MGVFTCAGDADVTYEFGFGQQILQTQPAFRFGFRHQNAVVVGATVAARFLGDQDALWIFADKQKKQMQRGAAKRFLRALQTAGRSVEISNRA